MFLLLAHALLTSCPFEAQSAFGSPCAYHGIGEPSFKMRRSVTTWSRSRETIAVEDRYKTADFQASADEILERMLATAARRFGAERAEILRPAITELAVNAARVQCFHLERHDRAAFYLNTKA